MATAPSLSVNAPAWTRGGDARLTGSKAPISPSSSSRMTAESCVNVLFDEDPEDRREVMAAAGVEELIERLPDALFGISSTKVSAPICLKAATRSATVAPLAAEAPIFIA